MTETLEYLNHYLLVKNLKDNIKVGSQWVTHTNPFISGHIITIKSIENDRVNYNYDVGVIDSYQIIKTFIKSIEQRWITKYFP